MRESKTDPLPEGTTSFHVRRASSGDPESLAWVVSRFSPLLLAQARYRMGEQLRRHYEPEDVVSDVWMVALPRLNGLARDDTRFTPVLVKFLSTILIHRVNRMARQHARRIAHLEAQPVECLAASANGVVTSSIQREVEGLVVKTMERLEPAEREIIVLRLIEQRPGDEVARLLGISLDAVHVRYHRAIKAARELLPGSVILDLAEWMS